MSPAPLKRLLFLLLVTAASWACLDFKRAYDNYCSVSGRCDDAGSGDAGNGDGGTSDAGQCLTEGAVCTGAFDCCTGLGCNRSGQPTGQCQVLGGPYLPDGWACYASDQCTNSFCNSDNVCESVSCRALARTCSGSNPCCPEFACREAFPSGCRQRTGTPCTSNGACEDLNCEDGLCALCKSMGATCSDTRSCCSGNCQGGTCVACITEGPLPGAACTDHRQCCNFQHCDAIQGRCCIPLDSFCSQDNECCSNRCGDNGTGAQTCLEPL